MKAAALSFFLLLTLSVRIIAIDLYVSPDGDDDWSGSMPSSNSAGTDGPFATIERAQAAARNYVQNADTDEKNISIKLRGGTHFIEKPLMLRPEDSGSEDLSITYEPYDGERPVLSGGEELSNFTPISLHGHDMIMTTVPSVTDGDRYFTQLFVNGRRAPRTRLPATGYYWIDSLPDVTEKTPWQAHQKHFIYRKDDLKLWDNLSDVDIVALHFWVDSRMPVLDIDPKTRTFTSTVPSTYRLTDDFNNKPGRYYVENVAEALPDQPGSWYLDRKKGVLYYHPLEGEDWQSAQFIIPRLERIMTLMGGQTSSERVSHITFRNLTFSHTEYLGSHRELTSRQAAVHVPGAVEVLWSTGIIFDQCEISHVGAYALEIGYGAEKIEIRNTLMSDLGAGGVKIDRGARGITVTDSLISGGGRVYTAGVGVWIGNSGNHNIAHNEITDLFYTGISVGWVWGYGLSRARNNIIEYNHIHHLGQRVLSDLGGVYTLGVSNGTLVRYNLIHDIYSWGYGGWGLYTDEGSSYIEMTHNIVYNTKTGGFHQHYGRENLIANNVLAFADVHQLQRTRLEDHVSFIFEKNIVYYSGGKLLGGTWREGNVEMDRNLYWNTGAGSGTRRGAVRFDDMILWSWRRLGNDKNSIVADPLFNDAANYDFSLSIDSPAYSLGFEPLDLSTAGPRIIPGVE